MRYVVTSLATGSAEHIYDTLYCVRGQGENLIKLVINLKTAKALGSQPLMAHPRHRKIADRSPLSVQERSYRGHHGNDRV